MYRRIRMCAHGQSHPREAELLLILVFLQPSRQVLTHRDERGVSRFPEEAGQLAFILSC